MKRKLLAWQPLFIFAIALCVRLLFNASLEHRVAHFGDAYYYLATAKAMLAFVTSPESLSQKLTELFGPNSHAINLVQAMESLNLKDRLLIDGPVYPGFLALQLAILHVNPADIHFDALCQPLAIFASILDALTCVFVFGIGRLAFNRTTGFLAALLFALYPGAIINTQHCYSEQFAYFLLSVWTYLTFRQVVSPPKMVSRQMLLMFALGITTSLVVLARPTFLLIPLSVSLFLLFCRLALKCRFLNRSGGIRPVSIACNLIGLALVLAPWLCFTKSASGHATLFVNRVPAFNFYLGNRLNFDGWKTWPIKDKVPHEMGLAASMLKPDMEAHPLEFIALQFRKTTRLWSGTWNEYQRSLLIFGPMALNVIHQLYLFVAFLGLVVLFRIVRNWKYSRHGVLGTSLGLLALAHFSYLPFEPISRYVVTAMPFVAILAAFALVRIALQGSGALRRFCLLMIFALFLFYAENLQIIGPAAIARFLPDKQIEQAPILIGLLYAICWAGLMQEARMVTRFFTCSGISLRISRIILFTGFTTAIITAFCCSAFDPAWRQWHTTLSKPNQQIQQEIFIPTNDKRWKSAPVVYLLIDLKSQHMLPEVDIKVNDKPVSFPLIPWLQLSGEDKETLEVMSIEGQGKGQDLRTFRQWWAVPVPQNMINFGAWNKITIQPKKPVTIWGDYAVNKVSKLPSWERISWTRGFGMLDQSDIRIYEATPSLLPTRSSFFSGTKWRVNDLSRDRGKQFGQYRIRFALPTIAPAGWVGRTDTEQAPLHNTDKNIAEQPVASTSNQAGNAPTANSEALTVQTANNILMKTFSYSMKLLKTDSVLRVQAKDPATFFVPNTSNLLAQFKPGDLSGFLYVLRAQIRNPNAKGSAHFSVTFSGKDASGKTISWNSAWEPASIDTDKKWTSVSFADFIPERIGKLNDLQVSVMVSPFHGDLLFLNKKKALKQELEVRNVNLSLVPQIGGMSAVFKENPAQTEWMLY